MKQNTRLKRCEQDTRKIKDKFIPERTASIVQAKTKKQELYLKYLRDKNVQVVIVLGLAGTGKTLLASHVAAEQWRAGEIEKIIVSRPYVQTGKTSGLKPGTSLEKMLPYVRNVLENIRRVVGHGAYNTALKDGVSGAIEVQELESIRGRSYDMPSMLIVDEAQQSTPDEMLALVTRAGESCKIVLCGDINQKDVRGKSGLEWLFELHSKHNLPGVRVVNFDCTSDVIRSGLVRSVITALIKDKCTKGVIDA